MKFGLRYCNTGRYTDPAQAVALMQAAEAAGFESAWTVEHTVIPRSYQSAYPYTSDGRLPGGEGDFLGGGAGEAFAGEEVHGGFDELAAAVGGR